jgi:hypothetical protein
VLSFKRGQATANVQFVRESAIRSSSDGFEGELEIINQIAHILDPDG